MGALTVCCKIFLVVVNIFFLLIGLVLFIIGMILRFADDLVDKYVEDAKTQLQNSVSGTGQGTLDLSNFDVNDLLFGIAIGLILFGLMLIIITVLGCCGACCQIKYMLIGYVVICSVLLITQIIVVGILYGSPDTFHDPAKTKLKEGIQSDYAGLRGSDVVSLSWNIAMIAVKCCGVDSYADFTAAPNWNVTYGPLTLVTPMACCTTLPTSSDISCAVVPNTEINYMSTGCYDKVWGSTLGNASIVTPVLVCVGIFQVALVVCGIIVLINSRDNKTYV